VPGVSQPGQQQPSSVTAAVGAGATVRLSEVLLRRLHRYRLYRFHTHRCLVGFMVNLVCGLIAYCHQPKKPSLHLDWRPFLQYSHLSKPDVILRPTVKGIVRRVFRISTYFRLEADLSAGDRIRSISGCFCGLAICR
jgi:hypothetical protein